MIFDILQYSFALRAFEAGVIIAIIAPLIGIFLVLRRFSLIADTLSHVSLAGVAVGFLLGINPIITALIATVLASLGVEKLRVSRKVYGESALALFLSGSLALAVVILSLAKGFNNNLFNYLFGSIVTVTVIDIYTISILAVIVFALLLFFYKELIYISFDEESAKVSGVNTKLVNFVIIILSALVISISIPIAGVLLISALLVLPVITALQFKKSFIKTIIIAEFFSITTVILGIFTSFYFNLSTGGTIVLMMILVFILSALYKK